MFKIPVNVHLDNIFSTAEPPVSKLVMVIHHRGQSIMQEDWFAVFKIRVTVRSHIITSTELLIFLQPYYNLESFVQKNRWLFSRSS